MTRVAHAWRRICIIAGDISPIDVITHIPLLCEENAIPYIYVPSKEVRDPHLHAFLYIKSFAPIVRQHQKHMSVLLPACATCNMHACMRRRWAWRA